MSVGHKTIVDLRINGDNMLFHVCYDNKHLSQLNFAPQYSPKTLHISLPETRFRLCKFIVTYTSCYCRWHFTRNVVSFRLIEAEQRIYA